jgi:hypothetical protein
MKCPCGGEFIESREPGGVKLKCSRCGSEMSMSEASWKLANGPHGAGILQALKRAMCQIGSAVAASNQPKPNNGNGKRTL